MSDNGTSAVKLAAAHPSFLFPHHGGDGSDDNDGHDDDDGDDDDEGHVAVKLAAAHPSCFLIMLVMMVMIMMENMMLMMIILMSNRPLPYPPILPLSSLSS